MKLIVKFVRSLWHKIRYNDYLDKKFVEKSFYNQVGHALDLNNPQSFNEKIQWMKLYDRRIIKTLLADKLAVRDIVKLSIGEEYLIPLVTHFKDPKKLCAENLPDYPVIVKTNHASGKVFIIEDKHNSDFDQIQKEIEKLLSYNFYHALRERQYKNIEPEIIVEKLIVKDDGSIPEDYKIHCFNGKPHFIQVDTERFEEHKRLLYTCDWEPMDITYRFPRSEQISKPKELSKLLELASALTKTFNYCRIDFYIVEGKIYFGEYTFTPGGGLESFEPASFDVELGRYFEVK